MHKTWLASEATKRSTWREVKAIELCLVSFLEIIKNSTITFYTDSQNAASVILKGTEIAQADFINRIIDVDDWQTTVEFFQFLDSMWVNIP